MPNVTGNKDYVLDAQATAGALPEPTPATAWMTVCHQLERIQVNGGWLYRTFDATGMAICFVPG